MTIPRYNPLIRNDKYLRQYAQLKTMSRNDTGDAVVTSTTTVACLVYQEEEGQETTSPAISLGIIHKACLPYSIRDDVKEHDHLANVTDRFGNVVLDDARIDKIIDYNHWRHEPRFFVVHLNADLD